METKEPKLAEHLFSREELDWLYSLAATGMKTPDDYNVGLIPQLDSPRKRFDDLANGIKKAEEEANWPKCRNCGQPAETTLCLCD